MTDRELALCLGRALNALGRIEGATLSMRDSVQRELGADYFSTEFEIALMEGLQDVKSELLEACEAIDGDVVLQEPVNPGSF